MPQAKLNLSKNALMILEQRYLLKNSKSRVIEKPEDLFRRVAKNIAQADAKYKNKNIKKTEEEFYNLMTSLDFLPNSPTLFNAGKKLQQLAACFVLPIEDDIHSIFKTLHDAALIHKTGAGTGFNFSRLRPKGDIIESAGFTSGPVSFMKIFDAATEQIKLGGTLRGANMGILSVDHPDIEDFITVKSKENVLTNFNVSVAVTDKFISALKKNKTYNLINPRTKKIVKKESARRIFRLICEQAWFNGDPGVIFIDRIDKYNPTPELGTIESTDSCGEQPLLPYESCNLGSINLSNFVDNKKINYQKFKKIIHTAVHFLDNVIDMCNYPLKENSKIVEKNRKIGLGVMGFADMLVKLEIPYDSDEGLKIAEESMKFISREASIASVNLAAQRGQFPAGKGSIGNRRNRYFKGCHMLLRNATRTTIAPTGTISIIADVSSGIEPLFALSYARKTAEGKILTYFDKNLKKVLMENRLYNDEIIEKINKEGSIQNISQIPETSINRKAIFDGDQKSSIFDKIRRIFVVGSDIAPEWHVKMQAAFQKYVDNGISKCINGNSIVFSQFGMLPIKNLGNAKDDSFSYNPIKVYSNNGVRVAKQFYNGGVRDTIKIETKYGYNLEGTTNHKIYVMDKSGKIIFKSLSEIKKGDYAVIQMGQNFFGNKNKIEPFYFEEKTTSKKHKLPKKLNEEFAFFLGCIISEGNLEERFIRITNCDKNVLNKLIKISKKLFGLSGRVDIDKRNGVTSLVINSKKLVKFLEHLGISGNAPNKSIPKCIMQTNKKNIIAFLNGLFLDAYIATTIKNRFGICLASKNLINQLHVLLLNFGIISNMYKKYDKTYSRYYYELQVAGENFHKLMRIVNFDERHKKENAKKYSSYHYNVGFNDVIPHIEAKIRRFIELSSKYKEKARVRGYGVFKKSYLKEHNIKVSRLKKALNYFKDGKNVALYKELKSLIDKNYFYDKIVFKGYGKTHVFDFHVPSNNRFFANGFINHNTVTLPKDATVEDVEKIFMMAYELGCKGISVYRYGSREGQVIYLSSKRDEQITLSGFLRK